MTQSLADEMNYITDELGLPSRSDLVRETLSDFVKNYRKTA